jgi:hypothetical protein
MNTGRNNKEIQELAYTIWEAEGRPLGQAERHWNMAVGLVGADNGQPMLGENLAGQNFLGDGIDSNQVSDIVADNREYSEVAQEVAQPSPSASSKQNKNRQQAMQGSSAETKNKKRPGKKKSSDNILV